ncbi:hypothetical protein PRUB_b0435 [Pseudoalteromonas rubra]|uniref:Uncharacterized protein n=1 Tax=Pseudoalteromonas rubra TaxID=43658 RepID=A0A8T0BZ66_9GAMM|nr:hypothetical protein PRUB_b0435 [Pseudoalteromonas rubra]
MIFWCLHHLPASRWMVFNFAKQDAAAWSQQALLWQCPGWQTN